MRISVITACYNSASTIADAMRSLHEQTHHDVEHIIVDGASQDGTTEIVRGLRRPFDIVICEKDHGVYDALNKGLRRVTGDIVGFLHADDVYSGVTVLEEVAAAFRASQCDFLYADLNYVDAEGRVRRVWKSGSFAPGRLRQGWMPPHPATFMTRELSREVGEFDCRYRIAADYDYLIRILKRRGVRVYHFAHTIVLMRLGGISNRDLKSIIRKSREDWHVLRRNRVGGTLSLIRKNLSKIHQLRGQR